MEINSFIKYNALMYTFHNALDYMNTRGVKICYLMMNRHHANTLSVAFIPPEKSCVVQKDGNFDYMLMCCV